MKYARIDDYCDQYTVTWLCRLLGGHVMDLLVPRSSSARAQANAARDAEILIIQNSIQE